MSTSPGNHGQLITSAYIAMPTSKSADPVQEAFNDASKYFKESLTQDECKRVWLDGMNSLEDVSDVLLKAKEKYETSKKSRARVWLSKFSARVTHYGKIIDVMAQHHPEYVSLVWGAMKFLFIAVLNQEELIAELSKALSAISDALFRVNLSAVLYPTEPMRQTVSMLYARIIRFFHRAMMWYKESRLKHMLTAITRPVALRYKDLVAEISDYVGRVDKLASSSANAELRDVHNAQDELTMMVMSLDLNVQEWMSQNGLIKQIALLLEKNQDSARIYMSQMEQRFMARISEQQTLSAAYHMDTTSQLRDLQWSQIIQQMSSTWLASPDHCLNTYKVKRKHLISAGAMPLVPIYQRQLSKRLQLWADGSQSEIIHLKGTQKMRWMSQSLAVDIIELLNLHQVPVIWALNTHQRQSEAITVVDILKQLVLQALQINPVIQRQSPVATSVFFTARNEEEWFNVLAEAITGMPALYVIFDIDIFAKTVDSEFDWSRAFQKLFEKLQKRNSSAPTLHVAVMSYNQLYSPTKIQDSGKHGATATVVPISTRSQLDATSSLGSRRQRAPVLHSARVSARAGGKGKGIIAIKKSKT